MTWGQGAIELATMLQQRAWIWAALGYAHPEQGDTAKAIALLEQSVQHFRCRLATLPGTTLYAFGVHQLIPTFPLPLTPGDQEPLVDRGQIRHDLYDQASYDLRLDYTGAPDLPLPSADAAWTEQLLGQQGLRPFLPE
jgi:hypothetical protein